MTCTHVIGRRRQFIRQGYMVALEKFTLEALLPSVHCVIWAETPVMIKQSKVAYSNVVADKLVSVDCKKSVRGEVRENLCVLTLITYRTIKMQLYGKLRILCFCFTILLQTANTFDELGSHAHVVSLAKRSTPQGISRQFVDCGTTTILEAGESAMIFSDTGSGRLKCKRTFQGPAGSTLGLTCQNFNLNSRGCKKERLIVKDPGFDKSKFCGSSSPFNYVTSDNSMIINHVRKPFSGRDCSGGYFCEISVL
ncbi:uncharacterized protein LOC135201887 [Macrobrachium nipponense]|uniref:uncharacterized protein LOC135201887 n=1 Tax=Macrobrachium nipponense TaxID=159736 RepID=UPI0030C824AF